MRRDHAIAAARPHHRDLRDIGFAALALLQEHAAECLVGEDAGEVVDTAIAFRLADDGYDLIRPELAVGDAGLETGCVFDGLELDLRNFNPHSYTPAFMRGLAWPLSITSYPGPRSIMADVLSRLPFMEVRSFAVAAVSTSSPAMTTP